MYMIYIYDGSVVLSHVKHVQQNQFISGPCDRTEVRRFKVQKRGVEISNKKRYKDINKSNLLVGLVIVLK